MTAIEPSTLGRLLGLIVHDLRNPTATLSANLAFLSHAGPDDEAQGALSDMGAAVAELMLGLEQLAWIGRSLAGELPLPIGDGDVGAALNVAARKSPLPVHVDPPDGPLRARGGGVLPRILEVLLANSGRHAPGGEVRLSARREGNAAVVELQDSGPAVGPELRDQVFTAAGQHVIKTRTDGRYGRVVGLFAAAVLADACGATLSADGRDGAAVFRVRLPVA